MVAYNSSGTNNKQGNVIGPICYTLGLMTARNYGKGDVTTQAGNTLIIGWPRLIASKLHRATGWSTRQLAVISRARVIFACLMLDSLHVDLIGGSHSWRSLQIFYWIGSSKSRNWSSSCKATMQCSRDHRSSSSWNIFWLVTWKPKSLCALGRDKIEAEKICTKPLSMISIQFNSTYHPGWKISLHKESKLPDLGIEKERTWQFFNCWITPPGDCGRHYRNKTYWVR